jgi:antirestriction protein ArdC
MTSAFVCVSLGIVPTVRHADYIGSWLEVLREDDRAIVRAASAASKAADHLLAYRSESDELPVSGKSGDVPASELSLTGSAS